MVIHRYINEDESANSRANLDGRPDEFLTNTSYRCEVVITNVSPEHKTFQLLYQIPAGSLPLGTTKYMKTNQNNLSPYTTSKIVFTFYFPSEGTYSHFPSNISIE